MLTRTIKLQAIAFVVIGLLGVYYLATNYIGVHVSTSGYEVRVILPAAGGLFENGEVTYRGVSVGRITKLQATEDGVVATVHIDEDAPPIPADSHVAVHDRSVIGEQYLDLRGTSSSGQMLAAGDTLRGGPDSMPPDIDKVLRSGRDFAGSVPNHSLDTVIDEAYEASHGTGKHLAGLIDTSRKFVRTANKNFLVTVGLINSSNQVLRTQQASSTDIRNFSHDLNLMATTLKKSDHDLHRLIGGTPAAARQIDLLFRQVGRPLGMLMSNLITPASVFGVNADGVQDALIRIPEALSLGFAVSGSHGMNLSLATTFFDPLPCTAGYGDTEVRTGLDTGPGEPFNTDAGCTLPPSSGVDVRGPESVPRPQLPEAPEQSPSGEDSSETPSVPAQVVDTLSGVKFADDLADLMGGVQ